MREREGENERMREGRGKEGRLKEGREGRRKEGREERGEKEPPWIWAAGYGPAVCVSVLQGVNRVIKIKCLRQRYYTISFVARKMQLQLCPELTKE